MELESKQDWMESIKCEKILSFESESVILNSEQMNATLFNYILRLESLLVWISIVKHISVVIEAFVKTSKTERLSVFIVSGMVRLSMICRSHLIVNDISKASEKAINSLPRTKLVARFDLDDGQ